MTTGKYILEGRQTVRCDELMVWAMWMEQNKRHVGNTTVGGIRVSTVFLGVDHNFGGGPPLLFETMIFGGPHDQHQERCSTWEEAEEMHRKACAMAGIA